MADVEQLQQAAQTAADDNTFASAITPHAEVNYVLPAAPPARYITQAAASPSPALTPAVPVAVPVVEVPSIAEINKLIGAKGIVGVCWDHPHNGSNRRLAYKVQLANGKIVNTAWEKMPRIYEDAEQRMVEFWNARKVIDWRIISRIQQHLASNDDFANPVTTSMIKRLSLEEQGNINALVHYNACHLYTPGINYSIAIKKCEEYQVGKLV